MLHYIVQYVIQTLLPMLYTSYYAMQKTLRANGLFLISISRYQPRFCRCDAWMPELAPTKEMFDMTQTQYKKAFAQILKALDPHKVMERINRITGGKPAVLLCYEAPDDFCHRHLVSAWLRKQGIEVAEYVKKEKEKAEQIVLI